jgi:5-(carboxyamino)imidazole ribonucleotide mutase
MKNYSSHIEIRTGSDSDIPRIKAAYRFLERLGIPYTPRILSAHRTPGVMADEARRLSENGFRVSIAAAGGSAHLPGMTASETLLPVVGIPVRTSVMGGIDSVLSIIQMPEGIPVGTTGVGQSEHAALLATQIAYLGEREIRNNIRSFRGIKNKLSGQINLNPVIGIVKTNATEFDPKKYQNMISFLQNAGIEIIEYDATNQSKSEALHYLAELEHKGAMANVVVYSVYHQIDREISPGFWASHTDIPTIALPVVTDADRAVDKITRIMLQDRLILEEFKTMPNWGAVAFMGINRYQNAALYGAQIAAVFFPSISREIKNYRSELASVVREKDERLITDGIEQFL